MRVSLTRLEVASAAPFSTIQGCDDLTLCGSVQQRIAHAACNAMLSLPARRAAVPEHGNRNDKSAFKVVAMVRRRLKFPWKVTGTARVPSRANARPRNDDVNFCAGRRVPWMPPYTLLDTSFDKTAEAPTGSFRNAPTFACGRAVRSWSLLNQSLPADGRRTLRSSTSVFP